MAIDKLNSLQFLFFRSDYFQEFGDRDGVYVDRVPFELRQRLLRWTWPTTERDQYFFQHKGRDVITREGWEAFVRWVCRAMDRQLGAEGEAMGRPADATSQRFASVWDAIENDTAEAEKMKRLSALRAAVPVQERDGRPFYVIVDDIPQPWRDQFWEALRGSQCPTVEGVERAAYVWDWQSWVRDLEDKA